MATGKEITVRIELTKREAKIVLVQLQRKLENNRSGIPPVTAENAYSKIKSAIGKAAIK